MQDHAHAFTAKYSHAICDLVLISQLCDLCGERIALSVQFICFLRGSAADAVIELAALCEQLFDFGFSVRDEYSNLPGVSILCFIKSTVCQENPSSLRRSSLSTKGIW